MQATALTETIAAPRSGSAGRISLACCLLAAAIVAATLTAFPGRVLQDPDNWWHVRVGLDILATGRFPTVDTYSHTFAGQPWIAKEWLGQVLLASAYQAVGWRGVVLLTISAVALTTFLLARELGRYFRPTLALGLTVLLAFLASSVFNARPFVLTFPILIVWTAQLFAAAREQRAPPLWLLPLLCLWANLHASFTLGFVIAFFAGLDVLVRTGLSKPRLLAMWIVFGLLCPLVTLINPYGVDAILATFSVAYGNEAVPYIKEWQPFSIAEFPAQGAVLAATLLALIVSRIRVGWVPAAFTLFCLYLFFEHGRFVYVVFLLVPLALAPEIARQCPSLSAETWARQPRDGLESFAARNFRSVRAGIAACLALMAALLLADPTIAPSRKSSASGALAYVSQHGITGNVLNSYFLGGTLIFHGIKTFIDGRTDQLFLDGFMKRDDASESSSQILRNHLERYRIDWVLLSSNDRRVALLETMPDWRRAYADEDAVIYLPAK